MPALIFALVTLLSTGEVLAFDSTEQATIDSLQQQITLLQAQLAQLTGSALDPADVVLLSWLVVGVLAIGFGVKAIKEHF